MQETWGSSGVRLKLSEGRTIRTQKEIDNFLKKRVFSGYFYSVLNHNSNTFANMFVKFLRGKDVSAEKYNCKVISVLNANPLNYVLHRVFDCKI